MDRSKLADLSEIISSIAIILTLIYLAVEINQNTNALNAESRVAVLEGRHGELFAIMENPSIVESIVKPEALSQSEQVSLSAFLYSTMSTREFAWGQYRDGVIDEEAWSTEVNVIAFIFDAKRNRQWWEKLGRATFNAEFAGFVDDVISSSPPSDTLWQRYADWAAVSTSD